MSARRLLPFNVMTPSRDYDRIARGAAQLLALDVRSRLQPLIDALWSGLRGTGISWIGIYLDQPSEPDDRRLVLGPCRDKPACSPIGLHGACGQSLLANKTLIVKDVADLGPNYIACDPRDRSEIVIPLSRPGEVPWGVLDADSWDLAAFTDADDAGFRAVLRAAALVG